jgi:hypothetical protein
MALAFPLWLSNSHIVIVKMSQEKDSSSHETYNVGDGR